MANAIGAENPARHESLNPEYKPDMTRGDGPDDLPVGQSVVPSSLRYGNYAEMSIPQGPDMESVRSPTVLSKSIQCQVVDCGKSYNRWGHPQRHISAYVP